MDKEYDVYLVLGSLLISFLTSFLAMVFASFIVWHKKTFSHWWLFGAALNMGLGVWAMHFVGMLALHIETPVAFETIRTLVSAVIAVLASYGALWIILSPDFRNQTSRLMFATFVLGSGFASMHYLGMDAMQMFPRISYEPSWFILSLVIAYGASYVGLHLFTRFTNQTLFSIANLGSAVVIGFAVSGMHYAGMAAAEFDPAAYCTVLDSGIRLGLLSIMVIALVIFMLLVSFILVAYEQKLEYEEVSHSQQLLSQVQSEVTRRTAELEQQKNMNERLLVTMDAIVVVLNKQGEICQFNMAAQNVTGYSLAELQGKFVWDYLIPEQQIESVKQVFNNLAAGKFPNKHQNDWVTKTGQAVTIQWNNSALVDESGEVQYVIATGLDVTQAIQDQQALQLSAVAFETQEAMVVTDPRQRILKVNRAFEEITGYQLEEVVGLPMNLLKSGKHDREFYLKMWDEIEQKGYWQGEIWNRKKNGDIYPEWLRITQVLDEQGKVINYIGNFSDITQRKKIEEELEFLAFYDTVTSLPNRRLFIDRLRQAIHNTKKQQQNLAVLFLDLDNFKHINDTYGHAYGDEVLIAYSGLLQKIVPADVTISRFGGDEFVILLTNLPARLESAVFACEHLAQDILHALEEGLDFLQQKAYLTSSIGITISDCTTDDVESLLMQADTAMYQAKEVGKNTFRFYSESIGESMAERFQMEQALRKDLQNVSIEQSNFKVLYQPQYNLDKQMVGAEALVRWQSDDFGLVSPMQFIPLAEESGLIDQLGMLVVRMVLRDIKALGQKIEQSSLQNISINLSIKQLSNPHLTEQLTAACKVNQVEPNKVCFEFTESAFLDSALDPKALFSEMSAAGFTFSLDDFGTGFSSLSYLKELPISELKIDKSFVDGIEDDESDRTICSATISMAQKLGLKVVAEGVENQQQFDWLVKHNCDVLQGYLMNKPMDFTEFEKLL